MRATALFLLLAMATGAGAAAQVPLYDDLGDHHYAVTASPDAQAYFDQGMRLYYAFNHQEAIRAFGEAQRLDPGGAMCWWGEALAYGPNINLPMDEPSAHAAHEAVQGAMARLDGVSAREQALIRALSVRYAADAPADRAHLDRAYAERMADVAARYPEDPEAAVLHAESLLDLRPWDYWTPDGEPQEGIAGALASLSRVMAADPKHPGACHFYIHAVEKLYPERAVPCAERLASLMPGAGHLVHMPGHIYIRVGRYMDAVSANEHAVHADETYIRDQSPGVGMYTVGYYPHNYDFMAFASMMIGRGTVAVESATRVAGLLPAEMWGTPGMDFMQHWSIRPLLVEVRFARWDEILETPAPPPSRPHALAIWHYARGRAMAARGDVDGARRELSGLDAIMAGDAIRDLRMEFNRSADLLSVASSVLAGRIEAAAGRYDRAAEHLEEAVRREDALLYGEPPEWTVPARQDLGAVLLEAGRAAYAERTFREDLDRFPENGWSLHGLAGALEAQGRGPEAAAVWADFERVWSTADFAMPRASTR